MRSELFHTNTSIYDIQITNPTSLPKVVHKHCGIKGHLLVYHSFHLCIITCYTNEFRCPLLAYSTGSDSSPAYAGLGVKATTTATSGAGIITTPTMDPVLVASPGRNIGFGSSDDCSKQFGRQLLLRLASFAAEIC